MPHLRALALLAFSGMIAHVVRADVDVDERGVLTSNVAFDVPEFHAIGPRVSLLAGSEITRRSATNGVARLDATDRFYLDGQELIPYAATTATNGGRADEARGATVPMRRRNAADTVAP